MPMPLDAATYEQRKAELALLQNQYLGQMALIAILVSVIAAALVVVVSPFSLPAAIRQYWHFPVLWIALFLALSPTLVLISPGKKLRKHKILYAAIADFEQAKLQYAKWQDTHTNKALAQSYMLANRAFDVLNDLPEFVTLHAAISEAYAQAANDAT